MVTFHDGGNVAWGKLATSIVGAVFLGWFTGVIRVIIVWTTVATSMISDVGEFAAQVVDVTLQQPTAAVEGSYSQLILTAGTAGVASFALSVLAVLAVLLAVQKVWQNYG